MMATFRCTGGRYPASRVRLDPGAIRAELTHLGDIIVLRIDDENNDERWEELQISVEDLIAFLSNPPQNQ